MPGRRRVQGQSAMKLRCFFGYHPWNYRIFGEAVIRLCKACCNCPQYWADGKWKPLEPLTEKKSPTVAVLGGIHQSLRVTPAMETGLTDHVWSLEEIAALSEPVKPDRETAEIPKWTTTRRRQRLAGSEISLR